MKIEINSKNKVLREYLTEKEHLTMSREEVDAEIFTLLVSALVAKIFELGDTKRERVEIYETVMQMMIVILAQMELKNEGK